VSSSDPLPNFALILAPHLQAIPDAARPGFLSQLERTAAERYRIWARSCPYPDEVDGLLACAAREDEIADRIEKLLPLQADQVEKVGEVVPKARDTYYEIFGDAEPLVQYRMQAHAERQGALAWRGLATQYDDPDLKAGLEECAKLEEASAEHLEDLLRRHGVDPA